MKKRAHTYKQEGEQMKRDALKKEHEEEVTAGELYNAVTRSIKEGEEYCDKHGF